MSFQLPSGLKPAQPPSSGSGSPGPSQGGSGGGADQAEAAERQRQNEEMKRGMIASMLAPQARERRQCFPLLLSTKNSISEGVGSGVNGSWVMGVC